MQKTFHLDSEGVYTEPYPKSHFQWLVDEIVPALARALVKQSSVQQRDRKVCRKKGDNSSLKMEALLCSVDLGASGNLDTSPTLWALLPPVCGTICLRRV